MPTKLKMPFLLRAYLALGTVVNTLVAFTFGATELFHIVDGREGASYFGLVFFSSQLVVDLFSVTWRISRALESARMNAVALLHRGVWVGLATWYAVNWADYGGSLAAGAGAVHLLGGFILFGLFWSNLPTFAWHLLLLHPGAREHARGKYLQPSPSQAHVTISA